jgi:four helix bundle protein
VNYKNFEELPCWQKAREQRSCGEVQSQLYRGLDRQYISQAEFHAVYELASDCRKQIKGFRKYMRKYRSEDKHD